MGVIDAAQIGDFACTMYHPDYVDPDLDLNIRSIKGGLSVRIETDIYALTAVAFEFLVGVRPFFVRTAPPQTEKQNRLDKASILHRLEAGSGHGARPSLQYVDGPENSAIEDRIRCLQQHDERLYQHFVSIFVRDERETLLTRLPLEDSRHPGHGFFTDIGFAEFIVEQLEKIAADRERQAREQRARIATSTSDVTSQDIGFGSVIARARGVFGRVIAGAGAASDAASPHTEPAPTTPTPIASNPLPEQEFLSFVKSFNLSPSSGGTH